MSGGKAQQIRVCTDCGAGFSPRGGRSVRCVDCQTKLRRMVRPGGGQKECIICGSQFRTYKSADKKCCSRTCWAKWLSIRQSGDKSHFWRGGLVKKHRLIRESHDYVLWRQDVFKRDDHTCKMCGKRGGRLAAHHIIRFSDDLALALDPTNGITLCWSCHGSIHGRESEYVERFFAITGGPALTNTDQLSVVWRNLEKAPDFGDQLPIVILHEAGQRHANDLVVLRLSDFVDHFGGEK